MKNGPSINLSWKELACKDGTPYPEKWRNNRAIQLAEVFELIRKVLGDKPITILSAYRTPSWNNKIGGAQYSQHMQGRALDLKPPKGVSVIEFYRKIRTISKVTNIKGIGLYNTFVHIDTRPSTKLVAWSGTGVKDSGNS